MYLTKQVETSESLALIQSQFKKSFEEQNTGVEKRILKVEYGLEQKLENQKVWHLKLFELSFIVFQLHKNPHFAKNT